MNTDRRGDRDLRILFPTDVGKCGRDIVQYLADLADTYPIMRNWTEHPGRAVLAMTREGNLEAIRAMNCICECITPYGWQNIANVAARHGHMDIVTWVHSNMNVNWQTVAFIARDAGHDEIAAYADGYEEVLEADWSDETDAFPLNFGPTGNPGEDKGEWVFDWRMQDYDEEFLPEQPLIIGDDMGSYETVDNYTPLSNNPGWGFRDEKIYAEDIYNDEFDEDEDLDRFAHPYWQDVIPA